MRSSALIGGPGAALEDLGGRRHDLARTPAETSRETMRGWRRGSPGRRSRGHANVYDAGVVVAEHPHREVAGTAALTSPQLGHSALMLATEQSIGNGSGALEPPR